MGYQQFENIHQTCCEPYCSKWKLGLPTVFVLFRDYIEPIQSNLLKLKNEASNRAFIRQHRKKLCLEVICLRDVIIKQHKIFFNSSVHINNQLQIQLERKMNNDVK